MAVSNIRSISFAFQLAHEMDAFIDSIPGHQTFSASTLLAIRTAYLSGILDAVCRGEASVAVESAVDRLNGLLFASGGSELALRASAAAVAESCVKDIAPLVSLTPEEVSAVLRTLLRPGPQAVALKTADASAVLKIEEAFAQRVALSSAPVGTAAESGLAAGTALSIRAEAAAPLDISLPLVRPYGITLRADCGALVVGYYRTVDDLSALTLDDTGGMSLSGLFFTVNERR